MLSVSSSTLDEVVHGQISPIPVVNQSIPVVPWNKQQESGLQTETFILLLHKLGFHLAADVGKCFPRIPHFWSADHILQLALKLGAVRRDSVSSDISALMDSTGEWGQQSVSAEFPKKKPEPLW